MKISYIAICYSRLGSGVGKKILDQVHQWRVQGHEVSFYLLTSHANSFEWKSSNEANRIWIDDKYISKQKNRIEAIKVAKKENPEIIYVRDAFPYLVNSGNSRMVLEVNSLQRNEIKNHSTIKKMLFFIMSKIYYGKWDAYVFVTDEIKKSLEVEVPSILKKPRAIVSNGIDFNRIPKLEPSKLSDVNFVFLGEPGLTWNGIESIIEFAHTVPSCRFHIIGENHLTGMDVPENINFYGFLQDHEYKEILEKCHVAIGTLSAKKKDMSQGCSLKTREYLAAGLPVIIRYDDVDFSGDTTKFILSIPQDEKPLASYSRQILEFAEEWRLSRVANHEILNISIETKERERLEFFNFLTTLP